MNGRFVPINKVNFEDGEVIDIEVVSRKKRAFSWRGALKHIKKSVDLQHEIKKEW